ncbi:MAG: hypothetical protein ACOYYS_11355 [Chloroflexota bacterium]
MARPRRTEVVIIPLKLWLLPGRDDDIIAYLQATAPRQRAAATVRAMRGGLKHQAHAPDETDEVNTILNDLGELWS